MVTYGFGNNENDENNEKPFQGLGNLRVVEFRVAAASCKLRVAVASCQNYNMKISSEDNVI